MSLGLGDFHSHLFPAVDDGARTIEDALEGIGRMTDCGVKAIITTPHLQASVKADPAHFDLVMEEMDQAWDAVSAAAAKAFPDLDFRRGHEVMLDIPDPDLSDVRLRLGGTDFVLVEWPRLQVPPGTLDVVARIVSSGLTPVIAHPERYSGIDTQLGVVLGWKEAGALLQGNYGSLVGRYGPRAQSLMTRLLEQGLLDYLSSDFHGRPEYHLFIESGIEALLGDGGEAQLELLGSVNPLRLFSGEGPVPVPPLHVERTLLGRLRSWMGG